MAQNVVPVIAVDSVSGLMSRHWRDEASLTIVNYTNKSYSVSWADYEGIYQPRTPDLPAYGVFDQSTYPSHPFVLIDESGKICYVVEAVKGDCIAYLETADASSDSVLLTAQAADSETSDRSINSDFASVLTITNKTGKNIRLIWLDFDGERVEYQTIKPGEKTSQCTFETHPWILAEVDGNREFVFHPKRGFCRIELEGVAL